MDNTYSTELFLDSSTLKAGTFDGKLECYTPSYDSSSNIIIKQMKGGERDE